MAELKRYFTGLVPCTTESMPPIKGRGWIAELATNTHGRDWRMSRNDEIAILAKSERTAQRAYDLILNAFRLHVGPYVGSKSEWQSVVREGEDEDLRWKHSTAGFPLAVEIAAKASCNRDWTYALSLYWLSQDLHANFDVDLFPMAEGQRSFCPNDHCRFAYAIVACHAIVEQLGLQIRASNKTPAFVDGKWNPPVLLDLEKRLRDSNVDLADPVGWHIRGGITRLERKRPLKILRKADWACWGVRDCHLEVVDAIADLRWLRNQVGAHNLRELVPLLSVYDVNNAQELARRLLLCSMGYSKETLASKREEYIAPDEEIQQRMAAQVKKAGFKFPPRPQS